VDPTAIDGARGRSGAANLAIAVLIASTSVLGSVVAWRATTAKDEASGAEEQALIRQAASNESDMYVGLFVDTAALDYMHLREAQARARALRTDAMSSRDASIRAATSLEASAYDRAARTIRQHMADSALTKSGTLDLDQVRRQYTGLERSLFALDAGPPKREAVQHQRAADKLKVVALGAVIAAFFLTLAQVSRSAVWRLYMAGGVGVLVAVIAGLIVIGLG
jgi:hypothetical protein